MRPATLVYAAGAAEIKKTIFNDFNIREGLKKINSFMSAMPPYGDQQDDFVDILIGIGHANKEKSK